MPRFTAFYCFTDLIKSFEYLPNQIAYFNPLKNRDTISHFKNVSRYILRSVGYK